MRPMQAATCVLVLATCLGCGSGSAGPKADSAAETFPVDFAGARTPTAAPAAFVPAFAVKGTVSVNVGKYPSAVAVNPKTNTVAVGHEPVAVAVNQSTNKIYVLNQKGKAAPDAVNADGTGSVTVIDGATNKTTTVPVDSEPGA